MSLHSEKTEMFAITAKHPHTAEIQDAEDGEKDINAYLVPQYAHEQQTQYVRASC